MAAAIAASIPVSKVGFIELPKVRVGSKAVIPVSVQNVRSWVKSGSRFRASGGLLLAKRRHSRIPVQADARPNTSTRQQIAKEAVILWEARHSN
jgi:hypothetical protein